MSRSGDILVLLAAFNAEEPLTGEAWAALSEEERARAAAFPLAADGRRFARGRALLRQAFGTLLPGEGAERAGILSEGLDRPVLQGHGAGFSVSHSGSALAVAVSRAGRVGIDIEPLRLLEPESIGVAFSASELGRLRSLDPAAASTASVVLWTEKEALAKFLGCPPGLDVAALTAEEAGCQLERWEERLAGESYALCLAHEAGEGGGIQLRHAQGWGGSQPRFVSQPL